MKTSALRKYHRRIGLVIGCFFVLQGLTGAIAQYRFWLMQATEPDVYQVTPQGKAATVSDIMAILEEGKSDFQVAHIMFPAAISPNTAVLVMGGRDKSKHDMSRLITVDQYNNTIINERSTMEGWIGGATFLHQWIIFGTTGRVILTLLGTGVIAFTSLGVAIWWRTRKVKPRSTVISLHRKAGVTASFFILTVAITGTWLNLAGWSEKSSGVNVLSSNMIHTGDHTEHSNLTANRVTTEMALNIARNEVGELHLAAFGPAGSHAKYYWFAFMNEQLRRVDLLIDPENGQLIGRYPAGVTEGGDGIRQWLFPIHTGFIIGPVGGVIYTVLGLSVSLWLITGWIMRRRLKRISN